MITNNHEPQHIAYWLDEQHQRRKEEAAAYYEYICNPDFSNTFTDEEKKWLNWWNYYESQFSYYSQFEITTLK